VNKQILKKKGSFTLELDERRLEVINRVVEEKGEAAIPDLLSLMEKNEDDPELIEMTIEVLRRMDEKIIDSLREYLRDKQKRLNANPREYKEEAYRTTLLVVIDLVGELGYQEDIPLIESFLGVFDQEKAHLIIYEAIAKLGGGSKYLDLLELLAFEDDFTEEMIEQVIMTLSYIDEPRALFDLLKITKFEWLDVNQKIMVENGLKRLLGFHKEFYELLKKDPYGKKVLKRLLEVNE
jgi:hypothetical protein